MLSDILYPMERDKIPGLSSVNDSSGHKRIDKLNDIFRKSQPLKPWPLRENKDSKVSTNYFVLISRKNWRWFTQSTMWKNEKFSLTKQIFRQINSLVIYLVKTLLWRNFWQKCMRPNRSNFHNVEITEILPNAFLAKISWK